MGLTEEQATLLIGRQAITIEALSVQKAQLEREVNGLKGQVAQYAKEVGALEAQIAEMQKQADEAK